MHDVIVIGAGPVGCAAALEGARLGLDVVLVDPLHSEEHGSTPAWIRFHALRDLCQQRHAGTRKLGPLIADAPWARGATERLAKMREVSLHGYLTGLRRQAERSGVRIRPGFARFVSPSEVCTGDGEVLEAGAIVIATGSRPRRTARFPLGPSVSDTDGFLTLGRIPRSLLVVGADIEGCELACLFAALGVHVTLLDRRSRLLRFVDKEILATLQVQMKDMGISVVLGEHIRELTSELSAREPHAEVCLESGRVERSEQVLLVTGREPRIEKLEIDRAGIKSGPNDFISVDEFFRTEQPGVYAVGEVIGSSAGRCGLLAHARIAMRHAAGLDSSIESDDPIVIYSIPEVSMVGLTAEAAWLLGLPCVVGIARYGDTLGGRIRGGDTDLLKLVFRREDFALMGVHVIGPGASELMHLGATLLARRATAHDLANTVFAPASLFETYGAAARDALGEGIARSEG